VPVDRPGGGRFVGPTSGLVGPTSGEQHALNDWGKPFAALLDLGHVSDDTDAS